MEKLYVGVDMGGTKCAVLLGDGGSTVLARTAFPTGADTPPDDVMKRVYAALDELLAARKLAYGDIAAIGVSCGGPLDSRRGVVQCPPNLPLWEEYPVTAKLTERTGAPAFLQNDANACALAEWRFGAGRGCDSMIFLTFGTGLGAGLILGGRLYEGANGMAGEAGHLRLAETGPLGYGKVGSFEGFCSGGGLARLAELRAAEHGLREYPRTARDLAIAARNGNAFAQAVINESATRLGQGLAVLVDLLNPQRIVIGSIYAHCEDLYRAPALKALRQEALGIAASVCELVPAQLGESIGDVAALTVAIEGLRG